MTESKYAIAELISTETDHWINIYADPDGDRIVNHLTPGFHVLAEVANDPNDTAIRVRIRRLNTHKIFITRDDKENYVSVENLRYTGIIQ